MSLGRTKGVGLSGVNGFIVEVEAHVAGGLPGFVISGLGDSAVKQAPERVKAVSSLVDGMLVNQRRSLLDYLKKKDASRYAALIAKLGLRK